MDLPNFLNRLLRPTQVVFFFFAQAKTKQKHTAQSIIRAKTNNLFNNFTVFSTNYNHGNEKKKKNHNFTTKQGPDKKIL